MCRAPEQFKPCRFAPRVKSETEQTYHMIYLVYARQKIKHANATLGAEHGAARASSRAQAQASSPSPVQPQERYR